MDFIPVSKGAMVELRYLWNSQRVENVLWFEGPADFSTGDLTALADGVRDWWIDQMRPLTGTDVLLTAVKATAMHSETAPTYELPVTVDNDGTASSTSVYNNTTWVVTMKTVERGRSFRGRNYIVGVPSAIVNENQVSSAYAFGVVGAYAQLLNATYVGLNLLSVCSRFHNGAPRTSGVLTAVTGFGYADFYLDTQRRRSPGRGS